MNGPTESQLFQTLVLQLAQGAWAALGKLPNPMTGKVERHLEAAGLTIDMIAALEARSRGNLSEEEKTLVEKTLRELRMNYLDEQKKEAEGSVAKAGAETEGGEERPEAAVARSEPDPEPDSEGEAPESGTA